MYKSRRRAALISCWIAQLWCAAESFDPVPKNFYLSVLRAGISSLNVAYNCYNSRSDWPFYGDGLGVRFGIYKGVVAWCLPRGCADVYPGGRSREVGARDAGPQFGGHDRLI